MSWNQKREPQSIVVIAALEQKRPTKKTLKSLEYILHLMRNVFKCILTESSCGYPSFFRAHGNDIFRNDIGNIHHLLHQKKEREKNNSGLSLQRLGNEIEMVAISYVLRLWVQFCKC